MGRGGAWFRWAVALLGLALVVGGYVDAWAHLGPANPLGPWSEVFADAAWLALTGLLAAALGLGVRRGMEWRGALPAGSHMALLGGVAFGLGALADVYWRAAFGFGTGLEALLAPPHLLELAGGGVMVAAPLSQALKDRPERADWPVILAAASTLSVLTFFTQFANPLAMVWPAGSPVASSPAWVGQNLGVVSILVQGSLLVGLMLLLVRSFAVPRGSLAAICAVNGLCLAFVSRHPELVPVLPATGLAADAMLLWVRPQAEGTTRLRIFSTAVPGVFALLYWAAVALGEGGGTWKPQLWIGVVLASSLTGFLVSYLAGIRRPPSAADAERRADRWPRRHVEIAPAVVKQALDALDDPAGLAANPLVHLACLGNGGAPALRGLLVDVVHELATSSPPRDAEAGRLLVDYYVKRVGSHDVIAERLHLSRPTFYRRLQLGLTLVAERLDELSELAGRSG